MSKCNRLKLQLAGAAFDLEKVHESTQEELNCGPVRNAAACEAMSSVLSHLWLGSWRDAEDAAALERNGITHVLNVAKEVPSQDECEAMARANVISLQIPMVDAHCEDIVRHFETAFAFIEEARAAKGKVLVHCRRGISRSPAIVVAYLMRFEHKEYETALSFVKERRACVSLNLAFREILEDYNPGTPMFSCCSRAGGGSGSSAVPTSRQNSQCITEEDASCESEGSKPSSLSTRGEPLAPTCHTK